MALFSYEEQTGLPLLREVGIPPEELTCIFISHNHRDHAGGLAELINACPNARIASRSPPLAEQYGERVFLPEDGEKVLEAAGMTVAEADGCLYCSVQAANGDQDHLVLALRSGKGAAS